MTLSTLTHDIATHSIIGLGIKTLSIMKLNEALSITKLNPTTLSITTHRNS